MEIREVCRDKDICGGCVYQGVLYEEQLSNKFGEVKGLLDKKDIRYGELLPIEGAPSRYGYRNKWNTPLAIWKRMVRDFGHAQEKAFYVHRNSGSVPAGS